ncbi:glycosyl hydrolase family 32-like protein, partial [Leptotrombidium deliense]
QLQQQCLAYSVDNGYNWMMYKQNPIIGNPGILDFRDPKVFRFDNYYVLVLAAGNRVLSTNLLQWHYLSEFGANHGSHDGVWDINPGGPNGGSATQYFIGTFDGEKFENINSAEKTLWIDYGPDCYAGITWFGTSNKNRCFIGWMNNWNYGNNVPTTPWRGQMTIPRTLSLAEIGNDVYLISQPVPMLAKLQDSKHKLIYPKEIRLNVGSSILLSGGAHLQSQAFDVKIIFDVNDLKEDDYFELIFANKAGEYISLSYSNYDKMYRFDRSHTNEVNFHNSFTRVSEAPRLINDRFIMKD